MIHEAFEVPNTFVRDVKEALMDKCVKMKICNLLAKTLILQH